jgi:DNA-binding NarL/FixJ family response regulator
MTIRIVIADDHPIVLSGIAQLLALESDLEVVARCTNGIEAREAIHRTRPDIVITDLVMPGCSGIDLQRDVSAMRIPARVILLTARIEHEQVMQALELGVAGVVLKESAPLQILDCIRRVAAGEQWLDQVIGLRTLDAVLRRQAAADRVAGVLTAREIEVVRMVATGLRNKEIADRLAISEGTVKAHLRTIFEKLRIESRVKLSIYARENALV